MMKCKKCNGTTMLVSRSVMLTEEWNGNQCASVTICKELGGVAEIVCKQCRYDGDVEPDGSDDSNMDCPSIQLDPAWQNSSPY